MSFESRKAPPLQGVGSLGGRPRCGCGETGRSARSGPGRPTSDHRHGAGSGGQVAAAPGARRPVPPAARVCSPGRAASQAPGRNREKNEEFSSESVVNGTNCKALKSRSSGGERKSLLRARLGVLRAEGLLQGLAPSLPLEKLPLMHHPSGGWEDLQPNFWFSLPLTYILAFSCLFCFPSSWEVNC